jgi:hypothetical protein
VSEVQRSAGLLASLIAGVTIGAIEAVLAISFAALVFGGYLSQFLADGIGPYLAAAAPTLAILAWRAGTRGVVGSVQDAAAPVLAIVAADTAIHGCSGAQRTWWPRRRLWSCGSAELRSSSWRPTSPSWPRRSIDGSRGRWRSGWVTR